MTIKLSITFKDHIKDPNLINQILEIPECKNHSISYNKHGIYKHEGVIENHCDELLTKIISIISREGIEISGLDFKINK